MAGIVIKINMTKSGIANGNPKPNGIIKNIAINAAKPNNIVTTISTIDPIVARNVSYIPNKV